MYSHQLELFQDLFSSDGKRVVIDDFNQLEPRVAAPVIGADELQKQVHTKLKEVE